MTRKRIHSQGGENHHKEGLAPKERTLKKTWLDRINDPELIEQRFKQIAEFGLRALEGLDDSQKVILDHFPGEGKAYTVGEVKHLITTMRDKDNPFTHGIEMPFIVLSTDPEEYFRQNEEETNRRKQYALEELEPYSDDQLLTYVHPNHFTDPMTGKAQYYQRTAKELREWIRSMDYQEADQVLSHIGGIRVISADPDISMVELQQRTIDNNRIFQEMVQAVIDKVNSDNAFKTKVAEAIKDLPDDAFISFPLEDGSQSPELSVRELKARLRPNEKKQ